MSDYSKPPKAVDPENDPYLVGDITEANEKIQHQRECLHMDEEIRPWPDGLQKLWPCCAAR